MSVFFLLLLLPLFSISFLYRGLIGASLWAELEIDQHVRDGVDTLQKVDDFFSQYGDDVRTTNST